MCGVEFQIITASTPPQNATLTPMKMVATSALNARPRRDRRATRCWDLGAKLVTPRSRSVGCVCIGVQSDELGSISACRCNRTTCFPAIEVVARSVADEAIGGAGCDSAARLVNLGLGVVSTL